VLGAAATSGRGGRSRAEGGVFTQLHLVPMSRPVFERFSSFIHEECGIKLPEAKKTMLEARLRKRLRARGMETFEEYCEFFFAPGGLEEELVHLLDVVTTNKTDFFRDAAQFDYLLGTALPALWQMGCGQRRPLEVWSAGCSTGEEVWTIAMVCEEFRLATPGFEYRIVATDLSTRVLAVAERGVYEEERVESVPVPLRRRHLRRSRDRSLGLVRVAPELRARVRFARLNLRQPPYAVPQSLGVIFCRNVLIYFDREFQRRLLTDLIGHLIPGGYLFLGHTESIQGMGLAVESRGGSIHRKGA
jgi:chemotaxis protein methyltransferase CheR